MHQFWSALGMFVAVMAFILWVRAGVYAGLIVALAGFKVRKDYRTFMTLQWRTLPLQKIIELDSAAVQTWGHEYIQKETIPVGLDFMSRRTFHNSQYKAMTDELSFDTERDDV